MVSLFSNDGVRLRLSQNEAMTQYPNYLYDPYAYPSNLSLMDYHWNLFYPQNHCAIQNKRKKKLKEQLSNERIFKEMLPSFEYKKAEIIDWLKSLTVADRLRVFSIQNDWLVASLIKMYKKWSDCNDIVFAMLTESKKATDDIKQSPQFEDLENHFYCRKKPSISTATPERQAIIEQAEKKIIENIRLYDSHEMYDTILFNEQFVQDIDAVVGFFEVISEGFAFTKPCKLSYDHNTKSLVWDSPLWFSSSSFQTFSAWIVSSMERVIWMQYFNEKKNSMKNTFLCEKTTSQISLKYKQDLMDFWKSLDKNKKKKMLSSAAEVYKAITSEKFNNDSKDCKDINQKLRLLFNTIYGMDKEGLSSSEEVTGYFQSLFTETDSEAVIYKILFTSFEEFGTMNNLICRKLTHKLKSMLSEKIATDLIMNEEKEKNNNKKISKKKKMTKGITKAASFPTPNNLEPELKESHICDLIKNPSENAKDGCNCLSIRETGQAESMEGGLEMRPSCNNVNCEIRSYTKSIIDKIVKKSIASSEKNESKGDRESSIPREPHVQSMTTEAEGGKIDRKLSFENHDALNNEISVKNLTLSTEHESDYHTESTSQNGDLSVSGKKETLTQGSQLAEKSDTDTQQNIERNNSHSDMKVLTSEEEESQVRKQRPKAQSSIINKEEGQKAHSEKTTEVKKSLQKEFENQNERKSKAQTRQNSKYIPSNQSKTSKPPSTGRTETDTTDSESGLLHGSGSQGEKFSENFQVPVKVQNAAVAEPKDSLGFIEVRPKKKKSVKPSHRNKQELKEGLKKKKEKNINQGEQANTDKEKPKTKVLAKPSIKIPPNESKKIEEAKKVNVAQSAVQIKTPTPKTVLENKPAPVCYSPPVTINKPSTPSLDSGTQNQSGSKGPTTLRKTLSLNSPSLDLGAIQASKVKNLAKEYFDSKFKKDIYDHVAVLTEKSNRMMHSRILVYKRLDHCIARTFPMYNMKTKIFGSCATGLALTTSDIDIAVCGIEAYDRATLCDCLLKINEIVKKFKWLISSKPILTAHVPVLKLEIDPKIKFCEILNEDGNNDLKLIRDMVSSQTPDLDLPAENQEDVKIKVDLTLESLGMMGYTIHMGYKSTEFADKMLQKYESLYIITMVLKEFLYNRKLLNTFQGGISSYCLTVMVVSVLRKFGDEGYMASLRRILKFYGETFQPEKMGITLSGADPFFMINHSYETAPLWIMDHNNFVEKRNIGQGAYSIKIILHEFEKASKTVELLQQKFEELVLQHKNSVNTLDDIGLLDDQEIKELLSSSILSSFMVPPPM